MPPGEIMVTCPNCENRASLPIAAVKRNNYYCAKCFKKIPMEGIRTVTGNNDSRPQPAHAKKSSRRHQR